MLHLLLDTSERHEESRCLNLGFLIAWKSVSIESSMLKKYAINTSFLHNIALVLSVAWLRRCLWQDEVRSEIDFPYAAEKSNLV